MPVSIGSTPMKVCYLGLIGGIHEPKFREAYSSDVILIVNVTFVVNYQYYTCLSTAVH